MTYAGARGKTANEMCLVLGFCQLKSTVHATFGATLGSLNSPKTQYILEIANRLFVQENFPIRKSFLQLTASHYSAGAGDVDFADSVVAAKVINDWVAKKTHDKITEIVTPTDVDGALLVLANAIYFKAEWLCPFNQDDTKQTSFYPTNSPPALVQMMRQTAKFNYTYDRRLRCQILELPYKGCKVSMYILLPRKKDGLASLESKLTFNVIVSALAKLRARRLSVGIPKFGIDAGLKLNSILKSMGMKRMFETFDFSGITPGGGLSVSHVLHKAFVKVDEEGTEAAAATIVITKSLSVVKRQFLADHPFLFLIRDRTTGSILFLGRLTKPLVSYE